MAVKISGDLFQNWITRGYKFGGYDHIVECTKGLPEGAKLVCTQYGQWDGFNAYPIIVMIFEHPDFELVPEGHQIPTYDIEFRELHYEPEQNG
jgi:hypothetical protein